MGVVLAIVVGVEAVYGLERLFILQTFLSTWLFIIGIVILVRLQYGRPLVRNMYVWHEYVSWVTFAGLQLTQSNWSIFAYLLRMCPLWWVSTNGSSRDNLDESGVVTSFLTTVSWLAMADPNLGTTIAWPRRRSNSGTTSMHSTMRRWWNQLDKLLLNYSSSTTTTTTAASSDKVSSPSFKVGRKVWPTPWRTVLRVTSTTWKINFGRSSANCVPKYGTGRAVAERWQIK